MKEKLLDWLAENISYIIIIVALIGMISVVATSTIETRQTVEEKHQHEISASTGQTEATFTLNSGANKPVITYDDETVLEVSGWSSTVTVDDRTRELWSHTFDYSKHGEEGDLYYTRGRDNYEIRQYTTVDHKSVTTEYYIVPDQGADIDDVTLSLAHYRWHYDNVTVSNETVSFEYSSNGQEYEGTVEIDGEYDDVYVNPSEEGYNYFTTDYSIEDPEPNERTLIARETITFNEVNSN